MFRAAAAIAALALFTFLMLARPVPRLAPDLEGRVVLITGASRGIGKGIAIGFGEQKAVVYITGRTLEGESSLAETCRLVRKAGASKCVPVQCDSASDAELEALFAKIFSEEGKIDVLVNNAFAAVNHLPKMMGKPFWEKGIETWDIMNKVGLRSHYVASIFAAAQMTKAKRGLIINISSFGGLNYIFDVAYGVGKSGMDRMARDMAIELVPDGVHAVSVWPGLVRTEHVQAGALDKNPPLPHRGAMPGQQALDLQELLRTPLSETPLFTGRAIAMLARDEDYTKQMAGKVLVSADLAHRYSVRDERGVLSPCFLSLKFILAAACKPLLLKYSLWEVADAALEDLGNPPKISQAMDYFWNISPQLRLPAWLIKLGLGAPNF